MAKKNKIKPIDIKYLGVPNICFSLTAKSDKREKVLSKQRIKRGFDDSETWSLRDTIGNFILPRLKRYREIMLVTIKDHDDFYKKVDQSIRAFELVVRDEGHFILSKKEEREYKKGMKAFHEIFLWLWW